MANVMQYKKVMATYQQLLEDNPGKALLIGEGIVAMLEDGCVLCAPMGLDGKPEADSAYDFDQRSFISEEGRWDGETAAQLLSSINTPTFVEL